MPKASLCFLSYERPEFLEKAVTTAIENAGTNDFEVIIHDDGSTERRDEIVKVIEKLRIRHLIEKVIYKQWGRNEGVGKAINTCRRLAEGEYFFKIDQDLIFKENWLFHALGILENNPEIALLGLFKYHHDPVDWEKTWIRNVENSPWNYEEHTHFCGSAFGIHSTTLLEYGIDSHSEAYAEDWDLMKRVEKAGYHCNALPHDDLVVNQGFGIGPSTVVQSDGTVRPIHKGLKERG